MKHAQLVLGPAGSGKSTYCATILEYCLNARRRAHAVNLDPAAEEFSYPVSIDVRELISLTDVAEELALGPNGGLVYCMEYLAENLAWLDDQLQDFDDDYLLIDCPGQVELYTHLPAMRQIVDHLQGAGYRVCAVFLLDGVFVNDTTRLIAGTLMCLSAMVQLELPHVNVLTKCDLVRDKEALERLVDPEFSQLLDESDMHAPKHLRPLNLALARIIEEYSMVGFHLLDRTDEESISALMLHIDNAIQYGEDEEHREPPGAQGPDGDDAGENAS